jgi:1-acyl-sn-glycerol-3-phosphate acyltransferase
METTARALEARVAEVVGEISGRRVRADQEIGLDSLGHAELAMALEEELGVWLPDGSASTTVREIVEALRPLQAAGRTPLLRPGIGEIQRLGEMVLGPIMDRYYRPEILGLEHVPPEGGVILVSNHDSFLDIPLLVRSSTRPVWFMSKEELFTTAFGRWFFHSLGGFPVSRDRNDLGSVRAGLAVLRWGRVLAMYPEGTRSTQLLPFLQGAAWMGLVTGAPIVPLRMTGTVDSMPPGSVWPRPSRVRITYGEALRPSAEPESRARLDRARELTMDLRREVERLGG